MSEYEIFINIKEATIKTERINKLFGLPKQGTKTYRLNILHPIVDPPDIRALGEVQQDLIDACSKMEPDERVKYYNTKDLIGLVEAYSEGWFQEKHI